MILFGHPTGNPNSHEAALAHFEAGRLAAFCVPWMPSAVELALLRRFPGIGSQAARLERRAFEPLRGAPLVQGRMGEWSRLVRRVAAKGHNSEALAYEANDWLMQTMARHVDRSDVTAVHAYEDCALAQFERAAEVGKRRIYDMPIGYYPAWEETQAALFRTYESWLPARGGASPLVRPAQKRRELELADVVLVPTSFVARTIARFSAVPTRLAPYGVDRDFWTPCTPTHDSGALRFIYAGQASIRKGTPLLLEAWTAAGLRDASLTLVGSWQMAEIRRRDLPRGVTFAGPLSRTDLRDAYRRSDVFVFPSFFEGFGLVLLEAMACGLPAIATDATAGPEVFDDLSGRVMPAGNLDALVDHLRWFSDHRHDLPSMRVAAIAAAARSTWTRYRQGVTQAVSEYC